MSSNRARATVPLAVAAVVAVSLAVSCAPVPGDSAPRSAPESGRRLAADRTSTTLPPGTTGPPAGPPSTAAVTTTLPATGVPEPTVPAPSTGSHVTAAARDTIGGCELFPADNAFHADVTSLSVTGASAATIDAIGRSTTLLAGFGSGVWSGSRLGIPTNVVDGPSTPTQDLIVSVDAQGTSEPYGVPWPSGVRFEGWPGRAWDRHLLVVDSATCRSWEAINLQSPLENLFGALLDRWYADKVVTVDLTSNDYRTGGTVKASGLSLLAGLVRYDEVASGSIDHALALSLPVISSGPSVWPADGTDGRSTDPASPRMGAWFRLRSDADLDGLGPQARVVARALQVHGAVLADTGPNAAISGEPDLRWDDADLAGLGRLTMSDFEIVDPSPMRVSSGSLRIR